jgi:hypothetical protein
LSCAILEPDLHEPTTAKAEEQATVRGFWHGRHLRPYQLVCLRSFVDRGHAVEIFAYDSELTFPDWIRRRDAREILPAERVMRYQHGFGRGSPSLHSNLFRYKMLHALGGWWVDLDIVLLQPTLPNLEIFAASVGHGEIVVTSALKFPRGHPLLLEAVERCLASGESCRWGQTGSDLLTDLMIKHDLIGVCQPLDTVYPIRFYELSFLFDPARKHEVRTRCANSPFLHLFNELWRSAAIPRDLAPPESSFLEQLFEQHEIGHRFPAAMAYSVVECLIAGLGLKP